MSRIDDVMEGLGYEHYLEDERRDPSPADLRDLERVLGARLPTDYAEFIRAYGFSMFGGVATVLLRADDCPWGREVTVDGFFGFGDATTSLVEMLATYAGRMPSNLLPIGDSPGGNIYCLSVRGDDVGSVYCWDHERRALGGWQRLDEIYSELEAAGVDVSGKGSDQAVMAWEELNAASLPHPPGYGNLYLAARTFTEFLESLRLREDEDDAA